MSMLIPNVMAQAETAAAQPNPMMSLAPFAIIFIIFYFLMIRPQKKKIEEEQSMLKELGKGDEIFTKSGLLGKIVGMTDKVVTLEVQDGVKFKMLRSHIGGLASKVFEKDPKKA